MRSRNVFEKFRMTNPLPRRAPTTKMCVHGAQAVKNEHLDYVSHRDETKGCHESELQRRDAVSAHSRQTIACEKNNRTCNISALC